jgi:hypothetical protein
VEAGSFRSNSPPVVHETVEGETIVVNLDTGSYYDLNHLGGSIFELLNSGMTVGQLADLIGRSYELDPAEAARTVEDFTNTLVTEQLLAPVTNGSAPPATTPNQPDLPSTYTEPVLNKYTDMQVLLMLDPVHEVDEAGWPSRA